MSDSDLARTWRISKNAVRKKKGCPPTIDNNVMFLLYFVLDIDNELD